MAIKLQIFTIKKSKVRLESYFLPVITLDSALRKDDSY